MCGRPIIIFAALGEMDFRFFSSWKGGGLALVFFFLFCCFVTERNFNLVPKQKEDFHGDHISRSTSQGSGIFFSRLVDCFLQ